MVLDSEGGEAMLRQRAPVYPNVLLDVDTQVDFLTPAGHRPVHNLAIVPNIQRVFQWARHCRLTVISSIDFHRITDPARDVPLHCLPGTAGINKLGCTLLPRRTLVQTDDTINLPHDLLARYRQIMFLKRWRRSDAQSQGRSPAHGNPGFQLHSPGHRAGRIDPHPGAGALGTATERVVDHGCLRLVGTAGGGPGDQATRGQGGADLHHRRADSDPAGPRPAAALNPNAAEAPQGLQPAGARPGGELSSAFGPRGVVLPSVVRR